jgi:ParB-like chromosome segregation protein Spo0J
MSNVESTAGNLKRPPPMPPVANLSEPDYAALVPHPFAALMPMMDEESFRMFKANIAKEGIKEPMSIYQGLLLDGRNRYRAARELGLKLTGAQFKTFDGTPAEAEAFVISANLHRRQLNNKQKQEFAQKMIAKYPDESDRALARMTSLSKSTIAAARDALAHSPDKRKFDAAVNAFDKLSDDQQVEFVSQFAREIRDILKELAAKSTG